MTEPALAQDSQGAGRQDTSIENPFVNKASVSSTLPTRPKPAVQPFHSSRQSRHGGRGSYADSSHATIQQSRAATAQKPGSLSSTSDSDMSTPVSSMDLEKASLTEHIPKSSRSKSEWHKQSRRGADPEKMASEGRNDSQHSHNSGITRSITYEEDDVEVDEGRQVQEKHALKILLFMSGPCVLLSAINTAWACIAIVITMLSQPIRICAKRPSFGQQLAGLLGPTLNLQLRCIYTPLSPYANEDGSYHTFMLVIVHILSPFLSFMLMFMAWVVAIYWASSAVVGDPAGQDKRDDGRETVLGLRRWWERWLLRSVKEE